MKCGHLFNGIGGFALAAHWMGWENIMHCEIDPFCNQVMNKHFPNSYQHEDIRTTDFAIWRGRIDLITGGFPCQPYSTAGKRKGTADDRHLWPEMLRAIREIQPSYVVGENVRGLTNWNGGLVFDQVQTDLEAEGYEVLPFLLPAAGVNAPHRRDRIWFVAHSTNARAEGVRPRKNEVYYPGVTAHAGCIISDRREIDGYEQSFNNGQNDRREEKADKSKRLYQESYAANANSTGLEKRVFAGIGGNEEKEIKCSWGELARTYTAPNWKEFPTKSPVCNGNDGLSIGLADITVPGKYGTRILTGKHAYGRWRKESIKALGNAIAPQVAFQIFKAIDLYEENIQNI